MNKVIQKWCFLRFCHDFGGPRASRRQPRRRNRNCPQKVDPGVTFRETILGHCCTQLDFLCILFVPTFMLIFGIAFGRPPASILNILGSFQSAFWCYFEHVFADAANLKKCISFKGNTCFGMCWASGFAFCLLTFCMCF